VEFTASPRGKWILENWEQMLPKFLRVFPHEFKRVLGVAVAQASRPVQTAEVAHG
jgi:glutamate synthase domain-containing protein 3